MPNHNKPTVKIRYRVLMALAWAVSLPAGAQYPNNYNQYNQGQPGQYGQSGQYGQYGQYGNNSGYGNYGNNQYGGGYGGGFNSGFGGMNSFGSGGFGNNSFGSGFGGMNSFGSGGFGNNSFGSGFGSNSYGSNSFGSNGFGNSRFGSRRSRNNNQDQTLSEGSTGVTEGSASSRSSRRNESLRNNGRSSRRSRGNDALQKGGSKQKGGVDPKTGKPAADAPAAARVQGKSNVVARKAPAAKGGGSAGQVEYLPEIRFDNSLENIKDTLYFTPSFMTVAPGDRFMTTVAYFSLKRKPVDEIDLWIHYNPSLMTPIWADPAKIKPNVDGEVESRVWADKGYIRLHARLASTPRGMSFELADIHWRALTATMEAPIKLEAPEGQMVAMLSGKENLVDGDSITNAHKAGVAVSIIPTSWDDAGLRTVSQVDEMTAPAPLEDGKRLRLALIAGQKEVATGQVGTLDVALVNPSALALDEVKLRIRFDPRAVTVLDADQDNYIMDGVNIFDGDFHEKFSFDGHVRNQVDPERGVIEYQVGSVMGPRKFPSGVMARIVYRMARDAGKAAFWLEAEDPALKVRATDVTARGVSLLGSTTEVAQEALHGVEVAVKPLILELNNQSEAKSAALH